MIDLISRDAILAYTEKQHKLNKVFESDDAYICFWEGINDREGDLKAKDVPPVKHGHWFIGKSWWKSTCSNCNVETDVTLDYAKSHYSYCPKCGADMRGENNG